MRALLSVYNKNHLLKLAQVLHTQGWQLLASGQTARYLRDAQVPVVEIADYTKSPEILGGRVKTLHPAVHGGLLAHSTPADQQQLQSLGWDYIDLVAVNLYPFVETVSQPDVTEAEIIEKIDIGGVALIRAAAKNYERVTLLCDPQDYADVIAALKKNKTINLEKRHALAAKGFAMTCAYDAAIAEWFARANKKASSTVVKKVLYPIQRLRYGENPHQSATWYGENPQETPLDAVVLQGKALSYNNLLDLEAAWRAVRNFTDPTVVIVKHVSPCGIASAATLVEAYQGAFASDPVSAFGGIMACNCAVDEKVVTAWGDLFVECIIAPDFTAAAQEMLKKRVNCRVLKTKATTFATQEWRSLYPGFLCQTVDNGDPPKTEYRVVTKKQPTLEQMRTLRFAWQACQQVKSNAIVLAQGTATVGIGGGQTNRIDAVRTAVTHAGARARSSVLASDAFFPFPDTVEAAAEAGIVAMIQPGGAKRDALVIAAADAADMAMVFTGIRHFRH